MFAVARLRSPFSKSTNVLVAWPPSARMVIRVGLVSGRVLDVIDCDTVRELRDHLAVELSCGEGAVRVLKGGVIVTDDHPADLIGLSAVVLSPLLAATGFSDGRLLFWEVGTCKSLADFLAHGAAISAIEVDWIALRALSLSVDGTLSAWDISDWAAPRRLASATDVTGRGGVIAIRADFSSGLALLNGGKGDLLFVDLENFF